MSATKKGRKLPAEWRANISAGNKGKKRTDEQRANISAGQTGENIGVGAKNNLLTLLRPKARGFVRRAYT